MKRLTVLVFLLLISFLIGCSGGSSGSSSGENNKNTTYTGVVVYSDLASVDVIVCYDINNNGVCDNNEPQTNSIAKNGAFSISTQENVSNTPLIAEFRAKTTLASLQANDKPNFVFNTPAEKTLLSALTTIVKGNMDMGMTLSEAVNKISTDLAINTDIFNENAYSPNSRLAEINDIIAGAIEVMSERLAELDFDDVSEVAILITHYITEQLSVIKGNVGVGIIEQIFNNTLAGKTKEDIEKELSAIQDGVKPPVFDCITVSTPAQLDAVRNNLSGNYCLRDNISLSGYSNWQPIGTTDTPFTGKFDGNS